jgi:hypothetical protein
MKEHSMCIGGSKSSNTQPPPPEQPTRFDYNAGQRMGGSQGRANAGTAAVMSPKVVGKTFGSDLGSTAPAGQ